MSSDRYPFTEIEAKWQREWEATKQFRVSEDPGRPKFYCLEMFPYPSGRIHMGHVRVYAIGDLLARYKWMRGFNVLHPMGWDAFGLPAENAAIEHGVHPAVWTYENIDNMRAQLRKMGISYDWDREVTTCDPAYYKWEQLIFIRMLERGLAYRKRSTVNWCPSCQTVLANEQVEAGRCWRCDSEVTRRDIDGWFFKITDYAEELLAWCDRLPGWPERVMTMQRNWIGKSEGAEFDLPAASRPELRLRVFTTRPDTAFGMTYAVLAPEHPLVDALVTDADERAGVERFRAEVARQSEVERTAEDRPKRGLRLTAHVVNPFNGVAIPLFIADYVLMTYGTGAIMAVPAHDQRDWQFARTYSLPIREVIAGGQVEKEAFVAIDRGTVVNSTTPDGSFSINGLEPAEAIPKITEWLEAKRKGRRAVNYKLRDWLFARQRYWGEPFPIVWVDGEPRPLPEEQLPLRLPETNEFKPSGTGESPLANLEAWVTTTDPATGKPARRETNTMPQWAGSCWYYLRFIDPKNDRQLVDPAKERYWMPVDLYVGGSEHAVLHLLYARFWHKVLYDIGVASTPEPFLKLVHQGTVLGEDNQKMSKSRGNVVNPDEMMDQFGADAVRLYEMFMGPLEAMKPWSTRGVEGITRFLDRVWRLIVTEDGGPSRAVIDTEPPLEQRRLLHQTIKKVTEDLEALRFNTAIAQMMVFTNEVTKLKNRPRVLLEPFVLLLSPFAPHIAEELWERLGKAPSVATQPWPPYDPALVARDRLTIPIQVNGKLRSKIEVPADSSEEQVVRLARQDAKLSEWLQGKTPRKVIYVEKKLVNFVV